MNPLQQRAETLLRDKTVAWRVQALTRATVVTLALLAVIYAIAFAVAYNAEKSDRRFFSYQQLVRTLQVEVLQARRHEKDFFLRNEVKYLDQHKANSTAIEATLEQLSASAPDAALGEVIPKLNKTLAAYRSEFEKAASENVTAGLNEESGFHGAMRNAVRAAEKDILDKPEFEVSMLRMRRHEKDFIQRVSVDYQKRHIAEREVFAGLLERARIAPDVKQKISGLVTEYGRAMDEFVEATLTANAASAKARDAARETEPITEELGKLVDERLLQNSERNATARIISTTAFVAALLLLGAALVFLTNTLATSIQQPLQHLTGVVEAMSQGDENVRSRMEGKDELNEFGRALDRLLDARVEVQRAIQKENDDLNDSVLRLLQAVAVLSRRDLTHKVPVTEDVTGPVADALNLLTRETAKTLRQVSDLSAEVTTASLAVKESGDEVMGVAAKEREEVEATAGALNDAAAAMARIAKLAQSCNQAADQAIKTTREALDTVNTTVGGINATRDTIRETEKRIKRLGERSQEISLAVSLISSVAERTHILALNASMHAASAGEAGRGFAVVADEVQRLAENARQATQQIASLVNNIQTDTADAVNAMNTAIEQVVAGSRLAERAGEQMQVTAENTDQLVRSVQQIAESSGEQAKASRELLTRADAIRRSTQETNDKLQEQSQQTDNLVQFAGGLLAAVRVFKLPE